MQADTALSVFTALAHGIGAAALLWFFAGLGGTLALSACIVLLLQGHLQRQSSLAPAPATMFLGYGLGFALIVAAALVFTTIAENIAANAIIGRFDVLLSEAIRQHNSRHAYQIFRWITHFGDTATLTVICIGVAITLIALRRPWLALAFAAAITGNGMLNRTLKAVFERTRPLHDQALLANGWSFPSGHSSGAVVTYGMLAYVLIRSTPRSWHLPIILLAIAIAFSTGFSRIYLQAHYASDVIAGFASGTAWLAVCISSIELARFYRSRRG
jgi:membrane-associated phospholipid phosphatase